MGPNFLFGYMPWNLLLLKTSIFNTIMWNSGNQIFNPLHGVCLLVGFSQPEFVVCILCLWQMVFLYSQLTGQLGRHHTSLKPCPQRLTAGAPIPLLLQSSDYVSRRRRVLDKQNREHYIPRGPRSYPKSCTKVSELMNILTATACIFSFPFILVIKWLPKHKV